MRGREAVGTELNPFLVWFGKLKVRAFGKRSTGKALDAALERVLSYAGPPSPAPPIHNIDRWWTPPVRAWLCRLHGGVEAEKGLGRELLRVAFARTMIALSGASFGHVSMSFAEEATTPDDLERVAEAQFREDVAFVRAGAEDNPTGEAHIVQGDARGMEAVRGERFDLVITSPPYPNRISYVRELRPYMYWRGFLKEARDAAELDWEAIGGTWGVATSRLAQWEPTWSDDDRPAALIAVLPKIRAAHAKNGPLLANYVDRYFEDTRRHLRALRPLVRDGGRIHYVVGNSTFYGHLVPVETLYAELMEAAGFADPEVEVLRKRHSKKGLFEYRVSAAA